MTEQNPKLDGRTRRGADIALAKRSISRASYDAILAGRIGLAKAKSIGRDGAPAADTARATVGPRTATRISRSDSTGDGPDTPPQPTLRVSKDDTTQECWCGCEELTSPNRRWRPGHDQRGKGIIRRAVNEGKEGALSELLREYGAERGLL